MTERDAPGVTSEPTPFVDDLLDIAAHIRPALLKLILIFVFGGLLAVAPGITRWVVVLLVMVGVPSILELRNRLREVEVKSAEAEKVKSWTRTALYIAMARVEELEAELVVARRQPDGTTSDPVYRSVGLDADAPNYIVDAARRAHRVALHPDRQPPERRQSAHDRYVLIDAAFDEIMQLRSNSSRS